jgi:DNA repair protein RecO (recombination protein O)
MDIRAKTDECLILRGRDYNETDRILIVFSRERGKMSCLAKGVRRNNSRLKASCQLFSYGKLTFSGGRGGLNIITQGETIDSQPALREDLTKIACASYVGELIDLALPEGKPQESLFILAVTTLTLLANADDPYLILKYFEIRLLAELGYRLQFGQCAYCGRGLKMAKFFVAPERGGLLCSTCFRAQDGLELSIGAVKLLDALLNWDLRRIFALKVSPAMQSEINAALAVYLDFFLGVQAKKARENLHIYYSETDI